MKRPIWFRRSASGTSWHPCSWQGWLTLALCLGMAGASLTWFPPGCWTLVGFGGSLALLILITAATEDPRP
jgi:hypothetical protein